MPTPLEWAISQGIQPQGGSPAPQPQAAPQQAQQDGFLKSVAKAVLMPWARVAASAAAVPKASWQVLTGDYAGANRTLDGTNVPVLGNVKPLGAVTPQQALTAEGAGQFARDTAGTAAQIAPYFMGIPNAPGATLGTKVLNGAISGGAGGGLSSAGRTLEQGGSMKDVAISGGAGALGGAAVGAAIPAIGAGVKKLSSLATGVPEKVLNRAVENPQAMEYGRKVLSENSDDPYLALAQRGASKLADQKQGAKDAWRAAAGSFAANSPDVTFDASGAAKKMVEPLAKFGIGAEYLDDGTVRLFQEGPKSISPSQLGHIQEWVDEVLGMKNLTVDQVPRVMQSFNRIYDEIPASAVDGGPTAAHAALMATKRPVQEFLDSVLPDSLRNANAMYGQYYDDMAAYGKKLMDKQGNVNPNTASPFLKGLMGDTKGAWRERVDPELLSRVQAVSDAVKTSHFFPQGGGIATNMGRVFGGLGAFSGGGIPAALGAALGMSPMVAGRVATGVGNAAQSGATDVLKKALTMGLAPSLGRGLIDTGKSILKK